MSLQARLLEWEDPLEERVPKLEAKVERIESDIVEMKTDIRRLDKKIDALHDKVTAGFVETKDAIHALQLSRAYDRVWYLLMSGALLGIMARAFQWI